MDVHTKKQRSFNMSRIKSRDTACECAFRKYIWSKGIRGYRKHARLPGKPDIYFPKIKLAVFVDGCFWHKCPKCFVKPVSNMKFWNRKIAENVKRDRRVNVLLKRNGIAVLRFREHILKNNLQGCFRSLKQALDTLEAKQ